MSKNVGNVLDFVEINFQDFYIFSHLYVYTFMYVFVIGRKCDISFMYLFLYNYLKLKHEKIFAITVSKKG